MNREDVIKKIEGIIGELDHYDYQMDIYREGDDLFKVVDKDDNVFDVVISYTNLYVFSVEGDQKYSLEDIDDIYLYMNINGNLSIRLNANNVIYTLVG